MTCTNTDPRPVPGWATPEALDHTALGFPPVVVADRELTARGYELAEMLLAHYARIRKTQRLKRRETTRVDLLGTKEESLAVHNKWDRRIGDLIKGQTVLERDMIKWITEATAWRPNGKTDDEPCVWPAPACWLGNTLWAMWIDHDQNPQLVRIDMPGMRVLSTFLMPGE